jgi:hypothetical protein
MPDPTVRTTHGLNGLGVPRLYFDECFERQLSIHATTAVSGREHFFSFDKCALQHGMSDFFSYLI